MVKITFYLNEPKDSSKNDKATQNGRTPKSLILEIHHDGCFTPITSRSYVGGHVSSVNVDDIDEFCLHDLKDKIVKPGYGLADLMYYHFLIPRLGLDYGLHPLNVDTNVPDVNRNLTPMCHRNLTKVWEQVSSKSLSIGDYANTGKQISGNEITGKQMVVHVEGDYTSGSDSEDSDYDSKHDEVFDDDEHIVEDVHVSMNNFCFTADPKHDISIGAVEVQEDDLDVIDYDLFGSDLDDGIDSERRIQLRELRRIDKHKNKGLDM
nr:transposase, mutator type [Tanacetum cinerariifolium]